MTKIAFIFCEAKEDRRYQDKLYSKGCKDMNNEVLHLEVMNEGIAFRLTDDDGNLHFAGRYLNFDNPKLIDFEPLDMQRENTGCVNLEYLEDGEWKQL